MKQIAILLLVIFGIGLVSSCKKEPKEPVLDMGKTNSATITEPVNQSIVLLEAQADSSINFIWSAAEYNLTDLETTKYLLQMDTIGGGFNSPKELTSSTELTYSTTVGSLNNLMKAYGFPADSANSVEFRVVSFINNSTEYTDAFSSVISNEFTPFTSDVPPPVGPDSLWVPGDYQGWNPGGAPNVFSPDQDGKYSGYIYFPDGGTFEFKFTAAPDWDHTNFGNGGDGVLDPDPEAGNLTVPGTGTYFFTVDTVALTWTQELRDFALVGTFNEWGDQPDAPLTWDDANWRWTITIDFDAATEFKWRANSDWAVNFGINDPDDGMLVQDGGNIIVADAGNYTIHLYLYEQVPRYEIIAN